MVTRRRKERAIVLVIVVGFAALVTILGLTTMQSNATSLPEALNLQSAARARYLAASGVSMAAHFLRVPPAAVNVGNYWTGVTGFSVDGSADTCDVTVSRSVTDAHNYIVTSTGVDRDADGTVRGRVSVVTEIVTPPPFTWTLNRAFTCGIAPDSCSGQNKFYGDFHANGAIDTQAWCNGTVSSTGSIRWRNAQAPQALLPNVAPVVLPPMNLNLARYCLHGVVREAKTYTASRLTVLNITALGGLSSISVYYQPGGNMTLIDTSSTLTAGPSGVGATVDVRASSVGVTGTLEVGSGVVSNSNPGGVLIVNGNLDVDSSFTGFVGTLIVNGDMKINAPATVGFYAMPNYPALIVSGKFSVAEPTTVEVRGAVFLGDRFEGNSPNLTIYGPIIAHGSSFASNFASAGTATFRWSADHKNVYDFSLARYQPMTLLRWVD